MATNPSAFVTSGGLAVQASTLIGGFALQNATPTILSWAVPNDGNMHRFILIGELVVSSAATGGQISASFNDPGGAARTPTALAASQTAGFHPMTGLEWTVAPGQTVTITQATALTAGAGIFYAEIWGT